MRDILLIAIVVLCCFVALGRPVFGILAFIGFGFLNPQSMTWGVGQTFRHSLFVSLSTIVGYFLCSEPKRFPSQRESLLLLALWSVFAVSTVFAIYPDLSLERLIYVSKILLMVFLATSLINTEHRLHLALYAIALPVGFFGLKGGLFAVATGGSYIVMGPEGSFIASNNAIGLALDMNIPLLLYLSKIETRRWLREIMRAMLILSYPAIICTLSRGAWLGLATVTLLIILKSKYKSFLVPLTGILAIILLPLLPQMLPERVMNRYDDLANYQEEASAQSRFWNWEFCKRVGLANPLTGGGFEFQSTETYALYFPEFMARWPGKNWTCHSTWYLIFGAQGFPGLVLLLSLIGSCFISLRYIGSYGTTHADVSWVCQCADMLQIAFCSFIVVGTFYDAVAFDMFYYLVGIVILLKERISHSALP